MQRRKKTQNPSTGGTSPKNVTSSPKRKRQKKRSSASNVFNSMMGAILLVIFGAFMYEFGALHAENNGKTGSTSTSTGTSNKVNTKTEVKEAFKNTIDDVKNLRNKIIKPSNDGMGHLEPLAPYLPIFPTIPNAEQLIKDTLSGVKPTIAGIIALSQKFLAELHDRNMELSEKKATGDEVISTFFELAGKHLLPFDQVYKDKPIFPIREDESIFLSLAAFREHLLTDTLTYAFDNAKHPDKLFIGAVIQNCFGKVLPDGTIDPSGKPCKTGAQVIGKNKKGRDMTKVSDAPIDVNGIFDFCNNPKYSKYCEAGQVRVIYVHETESLGPAMARYFASKLWGGETYYVQCDAHLQFAVEWDEKYRVEVQATSNYPKSILSSYPPGFNPGNGNTVHESNGARLCHCDTNPQDPNPIIRINTGSSYHGGEKQPTQIPFVAAGFFFARAEFLVEMPFDPLIPWCFMGEEIALSIRSWTHGWNIYAPRKNLIAHQYRPGRMGLPKFWGTVNRLYGRGGMNNMLQGPVIKRLKHLAGYPDATEEKIKEAGIEYVLTSMDEYGVGNVRTLKEYMKFAGISVDEEHDALKCTPIQWCTQGLKI
jgi:[Skp1-protein]-hydroxyproline N-acetylglucosaminyltransferase